MSQSSAAQLGQSILHFPYILRTRRNHALEHATIHVLSGRIRGLQMAGRSDASGFILIGEVETDQVVQAVSDALNRLRGGQRNLAIHPNCGTNLVTTGYLTSLTALIVTRGANERESFMARLPMLVIAMIAALIVSQPLGTWLQRHVTTDGDPGNMEVLSITRRDTSWFGRGVVVHRVETRST